MYDYLVILQYKAVDNYFYSIRRPYGVLDFLKINLIIYSLYNSLKYSSKKAAKSYPHKNLKQRRKRKNNRAIKFALLFFLFHKKLLSSAGRGRTCDRRVTLILLLLEGWTISSSFLDVSVSSLYGAPNQISDF